MPAISVKKSIVINAPVEKVYATVRNFQEWTPWSPWIIAEPDCPLDFPADGMSYSWNGTIIGSGSMTILDAKENHSIDYALEFLKPMKSKADVKFIFEPQSEGVKVTWTNDAKLPIFLFFFTKMFNSMVGMDYDRGLKMLKDYIETGSTKSILSFEGISTQNGFQYVGVNASCTLDEIDSSMKDSLCKVHGLIKDAGISPSGPPFAIYHKWDLSNLVTNYTLGIPLENIPSQLGAEFVSGEYPETPVYTIEHTGPYRHVGNAWSAGMFHSRSKVFKQVKKPHPFEIYVNDPEEVSEDEIVSKICFPCKQ